ncbi:MAG TPA: hypothetical protein PLC59_08015 [Bacteroidales bacterium]|jgi:hypothetical protein|nr:hypothetical protein [Bacteroidales bacterium]HQI45987.1 hypothetical protein [Bacteroidales bacterium]
MKYNVYNIVWNCRKELASELPKSLEVDLPDDGQDESKVSDSLSARIKDITGCNHFGFEYEALTPYRLAIKELTRRVIEYQTKNKKPEETALYEVLGKLEYDVRDYLTEFYK